MMLAETLDSMLPPGTGRRFGELHLSRSEDGRFSALHRDDMDNSSLEVVGTAANLREIAKFDEGGGYRPLKSAPSLRKGWKTETDDAAEFLKRLDAIYPGVFANWVAYENGELDPVPLRSTLDRQTGMNESAGRITDQMANQIMRTTCGKGCLRIIAWPIDDRCAVSRLEATARSIPLICTEACTFVINEAQRLAKEE